MHNILFQILMIVECMMMVRFLCRILKVSNSFIHSFCKSVIVIMHVCSGTKEELDSDGYSSDDDDLGGTNLQSLLCLMFTYTQIQLNYLAICYQKSRVTL